MEQHKKIITCSNCILDNTDDPDISFDDNGVCNYCNYYFKTAKQSVKSEKKDLDKIIAEIREAGKGKQYDCVIGVSGGVDSTYVAYLVKQRGLRPLAVHLDYGWNSELAVSNITNTLQALGIDLYTHVVDWEEIRDLQLAFLKASVVDIELINDFAIYALLHNQAYQRGIKYVLHGMNVETEGEILPAGWAHEKFDQLNILSIHRKFGKKKLRTYPRLSFFKRLYLNFVYKLKWVGILNYISYNKEEVKKKITAELGWRDYGGKHFESIFTRFYQAYILPRKFGIDKRKFHYSILICSGQMTRQEALEEMKKPVYDPEMLRSDYQFVLKKLGLTEEEFEAIMKQPPRSHLEYDSYLKKHYRYNEVFFRSIKPLTKIIKKIRKR
jgi:N-acetyl sugar amidotransferase